MSADVNAQALIRGHSDKHRLARDIVRGPSRLWLAVALAICVIVLGMPSEGHAATGTSTSLLSDHPAGSVYGEPVTFVATVTPLGAGTPTGTVIFTDGASTLATVPLSGGGQATLTTSTLSVSGSPHTIIATYSGDSAFSPSSGSFAQVVTQGTTTETLATSQSPTVFGQPVTLTATVTPNAPSTLTPSGTVIFMDGATPLATVTLNGSGQATFTTSTLSVSGSPHTITATYADSGGNYASSTATVTQSINPAATTTTVNTSGTPSGSGQSVTFTAIVTANSPSSATPTGTVTFTIDGGSSTTVSLSPAGTATFTTSSLSVSGSPHTITAVYNPADANFLASSASASQTVKNQTATSTSLASSQNPSQFGQLVTFTATVTGSGTPTGTVTFKDGAAVIGTGALNGAGVATFSTSALSVGSHSITATYNGDTFDLASTSAVLTQLVNVPADSIKLRALQVAVTKIEAQSSGQAISGAIDAAISEGFSDNGTLITGSDNGVRFNFAAEPQDNDKAKGSVEERVGGAFSALGYAPDKVLKAPPLRYAPREWLAWADVRGTGWSTSQQSGDIRGGQTNALLGLTRKLTANFLVGAFGGFENFDYTSQLLTGRLKGDGWTVGGYVGWQLLAGLRFDASVAHSGINYNGVAGTAFGNFSGSRWLTTAALIGTYKTFYGFEIEPSAKVYALWEHENSYVDSLGTLQGERNFSSGRASTGVKVAYPWLWSVGTLLTPYVGIYADYYFNKDDDVPPLAPILLPTQFVQGWSARITSGVAIALASGPKLSVGGEVGGLGNSFTVWSVRGRAAVPF
jgi:hypothetical protein